MGTECIALQLKQNESKADIYAIHTKAPAVKMDCSAVRNFF